MSVLWIFFGLTSLLNSLNCIGQNSRGSVIIIFDGLNTHIFPVIFYNCFSSKILYIFLRDVRFAWMQVRFLTGARNNIALFVFCCPISPLHAKKSLFAWAQPRQAYYVYAPIRCIWNCICYLELHILCGRGRRGIMGMFCVMTHQRHKNDLLFFYYVNFKKR